MKRVFALLLAVLLLACLSVPAFADGGDSNPGGTPEKEPTAPATGSIVVVALAVVACGAGTVFAITNRKSK